MGGGRSKREGIYVYVYSLEGLMLELKFQYFGHLMQRTDSSGTDFPDAGKD